MIEVDDGELGGDEGKIFISWRKISREECVVDVCHRSMKEDIVRCGLGGKLEHVIGIRNG